MGPRRPHRDPVGIFEIILGLLLVVAPLERGVLVYFAAAIWAMLGGLILLGDALYLRQQRAQSP